MGQLQNKSIDFCLNGNTITLERSQVIKSYLLIWVCHRPLLCIGYTGFYLYRSSYVIIFIVANMSDSATWIKFESWHFHFLLSLHFPLFYFAFALSTSGKLGRDKTWVQRKIVKKLWKKTCQWQDSNVWPADAQSSLLTIRPQGMASLNCSLVIYKLSMPKIQINKFSQTLNI